MAGKKKTKTDRIAESLHTPERFNELYQEWLKYQGRVVHPVSEQEVTIQELMDEEIGDIADAEFNKLKEAVPKEEAAEVEKVEKAVFDLGKRAYMAQHGLTKEPEGDELKKQFEANVRNFVVSIVSQTQAGRHIESYEHAIAEIMAADNPIYGREKQRSKLLDALVGQYATLTHKGEAEPIKGLSMRRYQHVKGELRTSYYTPHWKLKHAGILRDHGYEADFAKTAKGAEIMGTVEDLLGRGETNLKRTYIKAQHLKKKREDYKRRILDMAEHEEREDRSEAA
jgi:hypothetical protein